MDIKKRRVLVGNSYSANGYGRGQNTRKVYLIDGFYYAYHPAYAKQSFNPLMGEFEGYIPVNKIEMSSYTMFYQISSLESHKPA